MSLPTEDDDMLRRAEIEEMMRSDRARYFRDEPVQQEYRDIVSRMDGRPDALKLVQPGRLDIALANYRNQNPAGEEQSGEENSGAMPSKSEFVKVAQNGPLTGMNVPRNTAWFKTDGINRVEQRQSTAKVRKLPLSFELEDQLNYAAYKTGLGVEVRSGGQSPFGVEEVDWTGSDRHDDGGAADVKLFETVSGRKRYLNSNNDADRQKLQNFIRYSVVAGAKGIGHGYMGPETTHIGGGDVYAWRDQKKGAPPAFTWVQSMLDNGIAEREKLMKGGWDGMVDTMAKGRPLSLRPPNQAPSPHLSRKQRQEGFFLGKNPLPPLC